MTIIKVSTASRSSAVAGAIAGVVREHQRAEVQAIGAGAVNQAVKALILATGYLRQDGIQVSCVPEFAEVTIEDKVRTAIKLVVEPGHSPDASTDQNLHAGPGSNGRTGVRTERPLNASMGDVNSAFPS
jgi:stage V sporulation protein S